AVAIGERRLQLMLDRTYRALERLVRSHLGPIEPSQLPGDADCVHVILADAEAMHRQRVEHFIREHDAAKVLRPGIEPMHAPASIRHKLRDALALTLA